jgi:hypothetical protein
MYCYTIIRTDFCVDFIRSLCSVVRFRTMVDFIFRS